MSEANSCQLILKYMLINRGKFVKSFHDRMYYYSSDTKFGEVCGPLNTWMKKQDKLHDTYVENHTRGKLTINSPTHPPTH